MYCVRLSMRLHWNNRMLKIKVLLLSPAGGGGVLALDESTFTYWQTLTLWYDPLMQIYYILDAYRAVLNYFRHERPESPFRQGFSVENACFFNGKYKIKGHANAKQLSKGHSFLVVLLLRWVYISLSLAKTISEVPMIRLSVTPWS